MHHTVYDKSLLYFDENLVIHINESKMKYLEKIKSDTGFVFANLAFSELQVPVSHASRPNVSNFAIANQIRGII